MDKALRKDKQYALMIKAAGIFIIALTIAIGVFLLFKGTGTFVQGKHSIFEFLFSSEWNPTDSASNPSGGQVGAAVYIFGSILTCFLALLLALPFSVGLAIFMSEIVPQISNKYIRPAVEIYVGIPSVVYGWIGLTVLVPFIKTTFHAKMGGFSVLAAAIVLAVMIFPTITTVATDAIQSIPQDYREAALGLGSTRFQTISKVILPAAKKGIFVGVILGLARAFGEALAVAMVIGKTRAFPKSLLYPTSNLTAAIAADMGNTADGGEHNLALWSMALLLFLISMFLIFLIHKLGNEKKEEKHSHKRGMILTQKLKKLYGDKSDEK